MDRRPGDASKDRKVSYRAATVAGMGHSRVELDQLHDVQQHAVFERGGSGFITEQVAYGSSTAGWWVSKTCRGTTQAWLVAHERAAADTLDRWMRAGGWRRLEPAPS